MESYNDDDSYKDNLAAAMVGDEATIKAAPATKVATIPIQLYRAKDAASRRQTVLELLLEREDLTAQDILDYCQGRTVRPLEPNSPQALLANQQSIYRQRRQEVQGLLRKLKTGEARVDNDGRLVPVSDPNAPPAIALPPPPPVAAAQQQQQQQQLPPAAQWLDQDEEAREWIAQGEREAAAALARMRQQWRDQGVDDQDIELVRIPPDHDQANLTFRRVCYAVLAVVGCFTAIMLQTLPLSSPSYSDPDRLLGELLHLKTVQQHLSTCPNLSHRLENSSRWDYHHFVEKHLWGRSVQDDCADGVLHIPSRRKLTEKVVAARSVDKIMTNLAVNGVNVSWFFDCHVGIDGQDPVTEILVEDESSTSSDPPETCTANEHGKQCFRGIHDEFLSSSDVNTALELGARLILEGGDHDDIYSATSQVPPKLQRIVEKIQALLYNAYFIRNDIRPVAFRIGAEGPMDGTGIPSRLGLTNALPRPVKLLNLTNYVQYVERVGKRNGFAQFSLPWPFRVQPYRDECNLLADMQVDDRFMIHTMIFLSEGAGSEFRGGETLYVDDHPSNSNPRRKIRRGLVIDGATGRLVVSTGGLENRRCRLPIRAGVRAALQIWWQ